MTLDCESLEILSRARARCRWIDTETW